MYVALYQQKVDGIELRLVCLQIKKIEDVVYDLSLRNLIPRNAS